MNNENTILEVKNLHKSFGGNKIHDGISLSLNKGESLGLLGPSGTGKSVLLRALIGLEYIDSGEIFFKNQRIDTLKEKDYYPIRTKISYAFQNGALFDSMNVFENLAYPLYAHTKLTEAEIKTKVFEALKVVGLETKMNLMPSDLSGGMQKRVGLARSIILNPDIILYDEPTAGLDPLNVDNVVQIMNQLKKTGLSSIFVTHDIPAAKQACDRIIILANKKIIFNGTPTEMENSDSEFIKNFFIMERKIFV